MPATLARRLLAEFLGTGLLVAVVVGSGIAAQRMSSDGGVRLLANAIVTAAALPVLILVFGPVSGGHFNPVVSLTDWFFGRRAGDGLASGDLAVYVATQTAGAAAGALLANAMFAQASGFATHHRAGGHLWLGEMVATAGLLLVIFGLARTGNSRQAPWAIGAYIGAAYWFTSSTSFANPAVTIGRMFSNSFAGIAPASVPGFIAAQAVGGVLGAGLLTVLYPRAESPAVDVVIPHEDGRLPCSRGAPAATARSGRSPMARSDS